MIALRMYLHIGMVCGSDGLGSGWWDIKVVKKRYDEDSMTSEKWLLSCMVGNVNEGRVREQHNGKCQVEQMFGDGGCVVRPTRVYVSFA